MKKAQQGFTLIELMIVVAIIGILASVAIPAYDTYIKRSKFTEVVMATSPYRAAIEIALQGGRVTGANAAAVLAKLVPTKFGIPADAGASGNVTSVKTVKGVVTATGATTVDSKTYILTPTLNTTFTNVASWAETGTCIDAGLC